MKTFKDKVVVITGAGSGIGRALSIAFYQEGAFLALADIDEKGLMETSSQMDPTRLSQHKLDVAREEAVSDFAKDVVQKWGRVDVVINNAGVDLVGSVMETSTEEFKWLMDINFWGVVFGVRAFLPILFKEQEACIVNISSIFGLWGSPGQSAYVSSKFAVRGFSESLRAELMNTQVGVLTVFPGGVTTNIARRARVAAKSKVDQSSLERVSDEFLKTPPEIVAREILSAIKQKKDHLLVGFGAKKVGFLVRFFGALGSRWINRSTKFDPNKNRIS